MHRSTVLFALLAVGVTLALLLVGCSAIPEAMTAPADGGATAPGSTTVPEPTAAPTDGDATVPEAVAELPEGHALVSATVVRVVDGDTAVFRLAVGREEKTRFIGVDTPESTNSIEAYGKEASAYTRAALVPGKKVLLERDAEERDRYGRLLAYVWLERPAAITDTEIRAKMFNARLALDGYAQQMTIQPNSRYADYFTTYVREARAAGKGLWSGAQGESQVDEPEAADLAGAGFIGNRNSMIFHKPACSSVGAMSEKNKVPLSSRQSAVDAGFRPCQRCLP